MNHQAYNPSKCLACTSNNLLKHYKINEYQLLKCHDCGFEFVNNIPSVKELSNYYAECYSKNGGFKPKIRIGRKLKYKLFSYYIKYLCRRVKPIKLLDIGCNQGDIQYAVRNDQQFQASGIDFSTEALDFATSIGLNVKYGSLEEQKYQNDTFDFITAFHVIEHLHNPELTMQEIHRVLKTKGFFFAVMPCLSHPKAKINGKKWKYYTPPEHLWYFNINSLKIFSKRMGFKVKFCHCFYHRAHVFLLLQKI